jgi:pSer/pThr/pTyr-binding forkhead associated (FHA) protein
MRWMIKITLLRKSQFLREYILDAPARCLIGRGHECAIQVPSIEDFADVSRRHCRLEIEGNRVRVHDLNSLNGTYLNQIRVGQHRPSGAPVAIETEAVAKSGDEIRLGRKARLTVEFFTVAEESVQDKQTVIVARQTPD